MKRRAGGAIRALVAGAAKFGKLENECRETVVLGRARAMDLDGPAVAALEKAPTRAR